LIPTSRFADVCVRSLTRRDIPDCARYGGAAEREQGFRPQPVRPDRQHGPPARGFEADVEQGISLIESPIVNHQKKSPVEF